MSDMLLGLIVREAASRTEADKLAVLITFYALINWLLFHFFSKGKSYGVRGLALGTLVMFLSEECLRLLQLASWAIGNREAAVAIADFNHISNTYAIGLLAFLVYAASVTYRDFLAQRSGAP